MFFQNDGRGLKDILDDIFAMPDDADVARKKYKEQLHHDFVQGFINQVHHAIRQSTGETVAFGNKLHFSLYYELPEGLDKDISEKYQVVADLEWALRRDPALVGFEIKVVDSGYRDTEVDVSIKRK